MDFYFPFLFGLLSPFYIWTFIPLFYLDFYFPFLFRLLFPFSLWTFISLFYLDVYFPFLFGHFLNFFFNSFQFYFNSFSILVQFFFFYSFFIQWRSHFGFLLFFFSTLHAYIHLLFHKYLVKMQVRWKSNALSEIISTHTYTSREVVLTRRLITS